MSAPVGLSPVESFVLAEADPEAALWEITAAWTADGDEADRVQAVPLLREAVIALAGYGFVAVHDFPLRPADWKQEIPVPADGVKAATANVQSWLWRPAGSSLLTVSITDAAVPWL
ncbi:hypothetical protein [Actinoplanes friuliensis]|nr:hypothetical protein [Actinoplanes friuliensis]